MTTLPNAAYTDPRYLAAERSSVLSSTWQFAGRVSQIPNPGDVLPTTIAGVSVLLLRDEKGEIRAFENVCPHRGSRLVEQPCAGLRAIVCPYHGWTFRTDGTLLARPHFYGADRHDRPAPDEPRPGLWRLRAEIWFDWVYVNLDESAPPLLEAVAPLAERLDGYQFDGCVYGGELRFDVKANWKLANENYFDVLHKFKIHPELERAAPLRTSTCLEWDGDMAMSAHVLEKAEGGRGDGLPPLPGVSERVRQLGVAAHFFPNTNFMYWRDQVVLFVCDASAPGCTVERFLIYFAQEAMHEQYRAARQQVLDTWDHLNRQDIEPLESMQAGRLSQHFDGGSFSPYWDTAIVEYLSRLAAATTEPRLAQPG